MRSCWYLEYSWDIFFWNVEKSCCCFFFSLEVIYKQHQHSSRSKKKQKTSKSSQKLEIPTNLLIILKLSQNSSNHSSPFAPQEQKRTQIPPKINPSAVCSKSLAKAKTCHSPFKSVNANYSQINAFIWILLNEVSAQNLRAIRVKNLVKING